MTEARSRLSYEVSQDLITQNQRLMHKLEQAMETISELQASKPSSTYGTPTRPSRATSKDAPSIISMTEKEGSPLRSNDLDKDSEATHMSYSGSARSPYKSRGSAASRAVRGGDRTSTSPWRSTLREKNLDMSAMSSYLPARSTDSLAILNSRSEEIHRKVSDRYVFLVLRLLSFL